MRRGLLLQVWLAALVVLMAAGLGAWVYQLFQGLSVTGMNNVVSWGLYIVAFMYFVGLSAGGLIVVAGAQLIGTSQFKSLSRLAVLTSGVSILLAAAFIMPDIGRPERVLNIIISGQFRSPLLWDIGVITIYLAIAAIDLWLLTRPRESDAAMRVMSIVSLPVAVLVHSVTAWIFGLVIARPFWNTALLAPMFVSSALVSGLALLLLVALASQRFGGFKVERHLLGSLTGLLVAFIGVDLFFLFSEILTGLYSAEPDHLKQVMLLLTGTLAPLFWTEVVVCGLLPFALFLHTRTRASVPWMALGSALLLLGILFKRVNILMSAMINPLIQFSPGQPLGRPVESTESLWSAVGVYFPTWVEWTIGIGLLAFGGLLLTVGIQRLVLTETPQHERMDAAAGAGRDVRV